MMTLIDASSNAAPSLPGVRAETATTSKGAKRVAQILDAALDTLAEEGQESLTLDGIARRVGIRKGNLQYYFPTRSHLLRAALAEQIERHRRHWMSVHDRPAENARARLMHLIAFELEVNRDAKFVAQIREKWSLAERDDGARQLADDWNAWVTERYARLVGEIRGGLSKSACRQVAVVVYSLLVGSSAFCATDRAGARRRRGLERRIEQSILKIIETADG